MRGVRSSLVPPENGKTIKGSRTFLVEGYFSRLGWMSPDGRYFTAALDGLGMSFPHQETAEGIIAQFFQVDPDSLEPYSGCYQFLYREGWIKVDSEMIDPDDHLTDDQVRGLFELWQRFSSSDPVNETIRKVLQRNPLPLLDRRRGGEERNPE